MAYTAFMTIHYELPPTIPLGQDRLLAINVAQKVYFHSCTHLASYIVGSLAAYFATRCVDTDKRDIPWVSGRFFARVRANPRGIKPLNAGSFPPSQFIRLNHSIVSLQCVQLGCWVAALLAACVALFSAQFWIISKPGVIWSAVYASSQRALWSAAIGKD